MIQKYKQNMDEFMIQVPTQIFFGKTALNDLAESIKQFGDRVILVYGGGSIKKIGLYDQVIKILDEAGIFHCEIGGVQPNPRVSLIEEAIQIARENKVDVVLPVGGGSVIDTAKGIAGGYYYEGNFWDLAGKNITHDHVLPVITILTLPATGSEMATGCTLVNDHVTPHIKMGFHGPYIRPRVSFENPEYTYSLPKKQTASGVMDIMSHIFESYFSNEKRAYMQARTAEGMLRTLIKYTPIAFAEPDNYEARANIMYCSSWGNNGLIVKGNFVSWIVHGLENPINERYNTVHGDGLAVLTPAWMRWAKKPENLYRYADLAVNVFGLDKNLPEEELADLAIEKVQDFIQNVLGLPKNLRELGVQKEDIPKMAQVFSLPGKIEYQSEAFVPISVDGAIEIYNMAY